MKKLIFSALAFSTVAFGQTKMVEKITKKGNEIVIPYEKYVLPNGLTLIVHEDHSDPIVHVDVTYHVGSAREQVGRSGFAHFFEHMMFQGSDNVADEEHFKIVTESGGTLNGTTNTDRTNYFETLPSNQLERALWLEADRMGFLLDAVTQQKFEVQRATVKNERGQNYDNRPYGLATEKIAEALYPVGHPYSWLTIGYIEDLNRVNVEDLKKFFLRWYGPNNATLTIAGDLKPADVVKLTEKYFGSIPRGPEVKPQAKTVAVLDKDRYISYEDNVRFPMLQVSFPGVAARDKDEAAMDILADILGGGKSSIFYQNFVKSGVALQARVGNPTRELAGELSITVLSFPTKKLSAMDSLIRSSLVEFEKRGVTEDDLKKYKASFEAQMINSLSTVSGKGSTLAANQTFAGDANYIKKEMERYMKVTKEDVMRVYNTYIKNKPAVYLSIYPKGKSDLVAKPDNFTPAKRNTDVQESAEYKDLKYVKAKDTFDRSKKPAPGPNPVIGVPNYWTENFGNGLKVIGVKSDEVPSVTIQYSMDGGHRSENKSNAGISQLTASLMNESTMKHSAEEISEELDRLGSSISISSGSSEISMTISSLTKNLSATLKLAEEMLMSPKFDEKDFARLKKQQLEGIANQATQPTTIANNVYSKLLYGDNNIMSVAAIGTTTSVNAITLDDVKAFYKNFTPTNSNLVVVGDITKEQILPQLDFLKNWASRLVAPAKETEYPKIDKTKIYFVNKDKAAQSEIRIGYMAMPYDATGEYYKTTLMNYVLGGAFNSRINLNLREDKGWTYGARSGFGGSKYVGPYTASGGIKADATDSSVVEFMKEIKNYADNGIKAEELAFTKSSIGQSDALKYEAPGQKAGFLKRIIDYNLDKNYVATQNEILNTISVDEINALAKKHLPYNNMIIVIVGDKAKTFEGVKKLGYEVIEMDADGNVIPAPVVEKKEEVPATPVKTEEPKKDKKKKKEKKK